MRMPGLKGKGFANRVPYGSLIDNAARRGQPSVVLAYMKASKGALLERRGLLALRLKRTVSESGRARVEKQIRLLNDRIDDLGDHLFR